MIQPANQTTQTQAKAAAIAEARSIAAEVPARFGSAPATKVLAGSLCSTVMRIPNHRVRAPRGGDHHKLDKSMADAAAPDITAPAGSATSQR